MGLGNRIIKLKADFRNPLGKYSIYELNLRENDLSPLREHWKALLLRQRVEIDGKLWYVHAIEAFAIHDSQPHESIGLVLHEDIIGRNVSLAH